MFNVLKLLLPNEDIYFNERYYEEILDKGSIDLSIFYSEKEETCFIKFLLRSGNYVGWSDNIDRNNIESVRNEIKNILSQKLKDMEIEINQVKELLSKLEGQDERTDFTI